MHHKLSALPHSLVMQDLLNKSRLMPDSCPRREDTREAVAARRDAGTFPKRGVLDQYVEGQEDEGETRREESSADEESPEAEGDPSVSTGGSVAHLMDKQCLLGWTNRDSIVQARDCLAPAHHHCRRTTWLCNTLYLVLLYLARPLACAYGRRKKQIGSLYIVVWWTEHAPGGRNRS